MTINVINLASFIPIDGLPIENDISLKIYYDLKQKYNVNSIFIKPVTIAPFPLNYATRNLIERRSVFLKQDYIDPKYNIPVRFYDQGFFLARRFKVFNKPYPSTIEWHARKNSLFQIVEDFKPDLLHAHELCPSGYLAFKVFEKYGTNYILTIRGKYSPGLYENKKLLPVIQNASGITTPSWDLYTRFSPKWKISLIPHGLDPIWFSPRPTIVRTDELRLITVSRLLSMKNIDLVVKALSRLKKDGVSFRYEIVGDGPERKNLQNLINKLQLTQEVMIHGFQDPDYIVNLLASSNLFVLLSYPETFGRAYFEAIAQGVVPIGIRGTGASGHLDDRHGYFLDIEKDLTDQLEKLLKGINEKELRRKASACLEKASEFTNDTIVDKYFKQITDTYTPQECGRDE